MIDEVLYYIVSYKRLGLLNELCMQRGPQSNRAQEDCFRFIAFLMRHLLSSEVRSLIMLLSNATSCASQAFASVLFRDARRAKGRHR
jgi:hypothetical protein